MEDLGLLFEWFFAHLLGEYFIFVLQDICRQFEIRDVLLRFDVHFHVSDFLKGAQLAEFVLRQTIRAVEILLHI